MSADIEQPVEDAAVDTPVEEAAVEQPVAEAVERDVESDTLEIPDSSAEGGKARYVPLSALDGARREARELKSELQQAREGSAKAQQLEQRLADLEAHIQTIAPKAQAYDAIHAAQLAKQEPVAEDDSEAVELAQVLDLYTPEGKPDIAKAKKTLALMDKRAGKLAQDAVGPLAQHTVQQMSNVMLARAKATAAPNGAKPDAHVLEQVWAKLDPRLTATVDGAKQAWVAALGYSSSIAEAKPAARTPTGQFTKKEADEPLYTEKAGGKDTPDMPKLSPAEAKYLKDAGITEKEYFESAKTAPWLRR
jgi:hypothetical protein